MCEWQSFLSLGVCFCLIPFKAFQNTSPHPTARASIDSLDSTSVSWSWRVPWFLRLTPRLILWVLQRNDFFHVPGTQMTLVLNGKGLLLEGSDPKIEDKQVPGEYMILGFLSFSQKTNNMNAWKFDYSNKRFFESPPSQMIRPWFLKKKVWQLEVIQAVTFWSPNAGLVTNNLSKRSRFHLLMLQKSQTTHHRVGSRKLPLVNNGISTTCPSTGEFTWKTWCTIKMVYQY